MRLLELERRKRGMTQAELGGLAGVDASYICRAERHGMAYDGHLGKLASALGWEGPPGNLMKEVK
jgi:transcriptional regulator with XRE-family HTH domain